MSDSKKLMYEVIVTLEGEQALGEGQVTHRTFVETDYDLTLEDDKASEIVEGHCWQMGLMENNEDYSGYSSVQEFGGYEIVGKPKYVPDVIDIHQC